MITDKQAWKMYQRALKRNRRLKKQNKPFAKSFQELHTHNNKPLEPRWRTLWF